MQLVSQASQAMPLTLDGASGERGVCMLQFC